MVNWQRRSLAAAAASGALLLVACAGHDPAAPTPSVTTGPTGTVGTVPVTYAPGMVLISDGTTTVRIGDRSVTFPTTVTDAAFSPDGSRIAFIDADDNVATAHPDGTGVVVLTKKQAGVKRSSPTWFGTEIVFTYRPSNGVPSLHSIYANNSRTGSAYQDDEWLVAYPSSPEDGNTAPSASATYGAGAEFAFQHTGPQGPEVWVVDTNQRSPDGNKIAAGAAAEVSPDGMRVAFVAPNGQVAIVSAVDAKAAPVQVTFGVDSPSHLAWSSDGGKLAFETRTAVESVSTTVSKGATANPVTRMSDKPGVPTFVPVSRNTLLRLDSTDLVATSVAASRLRWPTQKEFFASEGNRARAALVTGTKGAGATLAAAAAAAWPALVVGPVLVNKGTGLDPRISAELKRVFGAVTPPLRPVVTIVGGTDSVSPQAEQALRNLGYETQRVGAADFATASLPPTWTGGDKARVVDLSDPAGLAAALTFGSGFGELGPLLFSQDGVLPAKAKELLNAVTTPLTIVPIDAAAAQAVSASWPGKPTGLTVAATVGGDAERLRAYAGRAKGVIVVDRRRPSDLLIACAIGASKDYAVLTVDGPTAIDPQVIAWLDAASGTIDNVVAVDSAGTLSRASVQAVAEAVSGDLGYTESTKG